MTVIAGLGAPKEVEVEMIARAMDRRRNATEKAATTNPSRGPTSESVFAVTVVAEQH
jgi:hypothetical protein